MTKNDLILAAAAGTLSINDLKSALMDLTNFANVNCDRPFQNQSVPVEDKLSLADVNATHQTRLNVVRMVRAAVNGGNRDAKLRSDQKIPAIKAFKDRVDAGLAEAKTWVETYMFEFGGDVDNKIW